MGAPEAAFPEDFGYFSSVRELADGRVLLADPLGKALYVVDMDAGIRTAFGSLGEGPGEYQQPDATWPLPGDSTLLVDLGNARLVRLGSDLGFGETHPIMSGTSEGSVGLSMMTMVLPQAVDGYGRVYTAGTRGAESVSDSGAIVRIDLAEESADTVASYMLRELKVDRTESAGGQSVSVQPIPYSPEDSWGVAADGSLVVARATDYRIEWLGPDGERVVGDALEYEPVSIGEEEKLEYFGAQVRGGGIMMAMTRTDGAVTTSLQRGGFGGGGEEPDLDVYDWPAVKPPFASGTIQVDSRSRAWIRRQVPAGADTRYDLFNREARHVASYTLGAFRQIVGFGPESVYVIAFDEFDLAYLERYALPDT